MKHLASLLALTWLLAASASVAEFDHTHGALDQLLKKHVTDALVDYPALKADSEKLDACLDEMAAVREADFQKWTQPQQLAFLMNLYNATTLRLILDHYPIKSIKKIGGFLSGPWDQPVVRLFGGTVTLGYVEHKILRKKYTEPRVHFAIVCAALGCPPLRSEAYLADKLNTQLDDQGEKFLGNARKNSVDARNRVVNLSPIFKWFSCDFEKKSGTVLKFVAPFFPADAQAEIAKGGYKIFYTDYDWSLNEKK
ncbi:MAG: DUF547 domain-containing protein [Pedosphaera sp.]|nr:DUF547 domain-containing protein [Pedosphaera sp.]